MNKLFLISSISLGLIFNAYCAQQDKPTRQIIAGVKDISTPLGIRQFDFFSLSDDFKEKPCLLYNEAHQNGGAAVIVATVINGFDDQKNIKILPLSEFKPTNIEDSLNSQVTYYYEIIEQPLFQDKTKLAFLDVTDVMINFLKGSKESGADLSDYGISLLNGQEDAMQCFNTVKALEKAYYEKQKEQQKEIRRTVEVHHYQPIIIRESYYTPVPTPFRVPVLVRSPYPVPYPVYVQVPAQPVTQNKEISVKKDREYFRPGVRTQVLHLKNSQAKFALQGVKAVEVSVVGEKLNDAKEKFLVNELIDQDQYREDLFEELLSSVIDNEGKIIATQSLTEIQEEKAVIKAQRKAKDAAFKEQRAQEKIKKEQEEQGKISELFIDIETKGSNVSMVLTKTSESIKLIQEDTLEISSKKKKKSKKTISGVVTVDNDDELLDQIIREQAIKDQKALQDESPQEKIRRSRVALVQRMRLNDRERHLVCSNQKCLLDVNYQVRTKDQKLLQCSQCKNTWYCNRDCQKADWPKHKFNCSKIEEPRAQQVSSSYYYPLADEYLGDYYLSEMQFLNSK